MPTFENDNPRPKQEKGNAEPGADFRPRRHDSRKSGNQNESFIPAQVPDAVKSSINNRINDIVRQSRGPDETMFAFREAWSLICWFFTGIPELFSRLFDHFSPNSEEDENNGTEDYDEDRNGAGDQDRGPAGQSNRAHRRGRRGGRRRSRGSGNKNDGTQSRDKAQ
jgi:hypothetical protein